MAVAVAAAGGVLVLVAVAVAVAVLVAVAVGAIGEGVLVGGALCDLLAVTVQVPQPVNEKVSVAEKEPCKPSAGMPLKSASQSCVEPAGRAIDGAEADTGEE